MQQNYEKLTYKKFQEIYREILEIFPFLSKKEKNVFVSGAEKILGNEKKFLSEPLEQINKFFVLLNNPHADVQQVKKKRGRKPKQKRKYFEWEMIDDVLYIKIPKWSAKTSEEAEKEADKIIRLCVSKENKYKGIIFDVRGNGGGHSFGASKLASIFLKKEVVYGKIFKKVDGEFRYKNTKRTANERYYIDKPIIILIDKKCFSSNELFIMPFKVSKRAIIIGETTRGGSANPKMIYIESDRKKYRIRIPTWRIFLKGEKKPLEETKIKPDILYKKKDIIKYAVKLLN